MKQSPHNWLVVLVLAMAALVACQQYPRLQLNAAWLSLARARANKAKEICSRWISKGDPVGESAMRCFGLATIAEDPSLAIAIWERGVGHIIWQMLKSAINAGDTSQIARYEELLEATGLPPWDIAEYAQYLYGLGRSEEALRVYSSALARYLDHPARPQWYRQALPIIDDPSALLALADQATREFPSDAVFHYHRARATFQLGQGDPSVSLEQALELDPRFAPSWALSAQMAMRNGDPERAYTLYGKALDIQPDQPWWQRARVVSLWRSDRTDEAFDLGSRLMDGDLSGFPPLYVTMAEMHRQLGQPNEVKMLLNRLNSLESYSEYRDSISGKVHQLHAWIDGPQVDPSATPDARGD